MPISPHHLIAYRDRVPTRSHSVATPEELERRSRQLAINSQREEEEKATTAAIANNGSRSWRHQRSKPTGDERKGEERRTKTPIRDRSRKQPPLASKNRSCNRQLTFDATPPTFTTSTTNTTKIYVRPTPTVIANHKRLKRHVPYFLRSRFQRECAKHFSNYLAASHQEDATKMTDAIAQLLLIPSYVLMRIGGGKKYKKKYNHHHRLIINDVFLNRITQVEGTQKIIQLNEEVLKDLDSEVQIDNIHHLQSKLALSKSEMMAQNKIERSIALIRTNHVGRATKVLIQPNVERKGGTSDEVTDQLQTLHPQDKGIIDETLTEMPENGCATSIDLTDPGESKLFDRFIRRMNNGSSPGISGWTGDMLVTLLTNKVCRYGLAQLISDMNNGKLPEDAKPYLLPSHLIALPKPVNKIRPISMGEVFYRAAALHGINSVIDEVATVLAPIQYGVSIAGGCEQAVHKLQHALTRNKPYRQAGIAVDFKNAFNERRRDQILESLYKEEKLKPLWKLTEWAYSSPSPLWLRNCEGEMIQPTELQSTSGVKQGDPLGSLLFALSVKSMYNDAVESDTTGTVSAIAFQDDITLVGPPDGRLTAALLTLKEKAEEGGLEINMSKTKLLWLHTDVKAEEGLSESVKEELTSLDIEIVEGAVKLLGACIGTDVSKLQLLATTIIQEHKTFFERLNSSLMPLQDGMLLLRLCGLPRFNYLSRTTLPQILLPAAAIFDKMISDTVTRKYSIPLIPAIHNHTNNVIVRAHKQLMLPIKMSGLGLRTAKSLIYQAYLASVISCIDNDTEWWSENKPTSETNPLLIESYKQIISQVRKEIRPKETIYCPEINEDGRDPDLITFVNQFNIKSLKNPSNNNEDIDERLNNNTPKLSKLQRMWGQSYYKQQLSELIQNIKEEEDQVSKHRDLVRLKLLQHGSINLSHMWLQVIPSESILILSADDYRLALNMRLGLHPYDHLTKCQCVCTKRDAFINDPYHALTCDVTRYKGYHTRHNLILYRLAEFARRVQIFTDIEPTNMSQKKKSTPDLILMPTNEVHIVDVTAIHPLTIDKIKRITSKLNQLQNEMIDDDEEINSELELEKEEEQTQIGLTTAGKQKRQKYKEMIHEHQARFSTAAVYTTGGVSEEFRAVIDSIGTEAFKTNSGWDASEIVIGVRSAVAIAIQIGNAKIIRANRNMVLKRLMYQQKEPTPIPVPAKEKSRVNVVEIDYEELEEEKESNQAELQLHNKRQNKDNSTEIQMETKYDSETETEIIVES